MVMQTKEEVTKELTRAGVEQKIAELIGDEFMLAELTAGLDKLLDSEEVEEGCAEDIIRMAGREEEGKIKFGMRYRVRIPSHLKMRICKGCYAFLVPGETARIRLRGDYITTTCLRCGKQMRRPYKGLGE